MENLLKETAKKIDEATEWSKEFLAEASKEKDREKWDEYKVVYDCLRYAENNLYNAIEKIKEINKKNQKL